MTFLPAGSSGTNNSLLRVRELYIFRGGSLTPSGAVGFVHGGWVRVVDILGVNVNSAGRDFADSWERRGRRVMRLDWEDDAVGVGVRFRD